MKKIQIIYWFFVVLMTFQFIGCQNEPLEGDFVQDGDVVTAEEGQFVATVEGNDVVAISSGAVITVDGILTITGIITDTGEEIYLILENPGLGTHNITAGLGNENNGLYYDGIDLTNPYTTAAALEGTGVLNLTEMDFDLYIISGTFSFTGVRPSLDADGNPIVDDQGNPVIETIEITKGSFNSIPLTIEVPEPTDEFFAKVDGVSFVPDSIAVTQSLVGGVSMITVQAFRSTGERMRIDFPESIGIGTFDMVPISDGTEIIGSYNANTGTEDLTSNPGTLVITEMNGNTGTVRGTFEFTGSDPLGQNPTVVEVTEGSFTLLNLDLSIISNIFSADVDDQTYTPDSITASQSMINGNPVIIIQAVNTETNEGMSLLFPADITEGTHLMSPAIVTGNEKIGFYIPDIGNSTVYSSDPGSLTITAIDTELNTFEGIFQFIATDPDGADPATYTITNGSFLIVVE